MAQSQISFFVDDVAVSFRQAENVGETLGTVPDWNSGMFGGASNSPGIGISTENPNLEESLPSWTLLDQFGNARAGQRGQLIGGDGLVSRDTDNAFTWDRDAPLYTENGRASSGGSPFTEPDSTIRLMPADQLPTNAEKDLFADKPNPTRVDGNLTFPAENATLVDLAVGWDVPAP